MLGILKSGEKVFDRPRSHLHAGVAELLPEVLPLIDSDGREFFRVEHDFGRVVGNTTCVSTTPGEHIVFAQRPRRAGLTRFVKNRQAEPCTSLVLVLKRVPEGYLLITGFIGGNSPVEPFDQNATEESVVFWNAHALVWGSEPVVEGSEIDFPPLSTNLFVAPTSDDLDAVLTAALALGQERHPNARPQHHAAFANSVAAAVTGWSGGYGGPSLREHTAARLIPAGGGLSYLEAILGVEEVCYGPIGPWHAAILSETEDGGHPSGVGGFDNPVGDVDAAIELIARLPQCLQWRGR